MRMPQFEQPTPQRIILLIAIGTTVGIILSFTFSREQIYWGKLIEGFGSIGTAGAFGVSLYLLYQSQKDRRVEQAKRVNIWNDSLKDPKTGPEQFTYHTVKYHLKNTSDAPVYSVAFRASFGVRGTFVRRVGAIGPGEEVQNIIQLPAAPRGESFQADFVFTDAAGRIWKRSKNGLLHDVSNANLAFFYEQDAGGYSSLDEHPTINIGEEIFRT